MSSGTGGVPKIFLLKTESLPQDGYEEYFLDLYQEKPVFVPVLEHRFDGGNLAVVRELLEKKQFGATCRYGGLIFTSQRAVEAFGRLVNERKGKFFFHCHFDRERRYIHTPATIGLRF